MARAGIVGLGLIGGSLGLRLARSGWSVSGCDPDPEARTVARRRGAVSSLAADPVSLAAGSDLLFLAAPPAAILDLLGELSRATLDRALLVTDTASVKSEVAARGRALFGSLGADAGAGAGVRFIPGHPMAGAETRGPAGARADLFEGAPWYLCPDAGVEAGVPSILLEAIVATGARPCLISPEEHDRRVAALSHVPQLLAWLQCRDWREEGLPEGAGGPAAREIERLGRSSPELWAGILIQNRLPVARALRRLEPGLARLARALEETEEEAGLRRLLEELRP